MLVKRPAAHRKTTSDLLGTTLQSQQGTGLFFNPKRHRERIATLLGTFNRQLTGLLWAEARRPCIATQLADDRGLVVSDQTGDLHNAVLGFHKAGTLVSFDLAELFVIHRATWICRSGSLER